jgi:uncharacterized protein YciI
VLAGPKAATSGPVDKVHAVPVFAVTYEYDQRDDVRDAVRPDHRAFLRGLHDAGVHLASGPLTGGSGSGALLLLRADDEEDALAVLDEDPFWTAGVVADRSARGWDPVIGPWA